MVNFISSKATVRGYIESEAVILGPTVVGERTIIGRNVIMGYPSKRTLNALDLITPVTIKEYDIMSKGSRVGEGCIIRPGTVIYEMAMLGNRVQTGHNVLIREGSTIGDGSLIGSSTKLDGTVKIGKNVNIQSNAYLPHLTVIEDNVFIAPNVCFTNDPYPQSGRLVGVRVCRNAIICANATILPGVEIGEGAVVGAGSVVTQDVPDGSVVVGNPARFHMTRKEFDEKRRRWIEG